jgi:osmotically-inducible protein OsmY
MKAFAIVGLGLALAGTGACNRDNKVANDNTEKNGRDKDDKTLTPMDQSNDEVDRKITQSIRSNLMKSDSLSTYAKNVKIVTIHGVVTLRGPVESAQEKSDVAAVAKKIDGVQDLHNELEVAN